MVTLRIKSKEDSTVFHYGWWKGFRAFYLRDMKNDKVIISLSNKDKGPGSSVLWDIIHEESNCLGLARKNEVLNFKISWKFIKAGEATIRNKGIVDIDGEQAYFIETTARSASIIDAFYRVRDVNHSWMSTKDYHSFGYGQSVKEGGFRRDEWVTFDYDNNKYYGQKKKKDGLIREFDGELNKYVYDILGAFFYVRTKDLEVGKSVIVDVNNRRKTYPLEIEVIKKETIKVPAGKFDCIVVEPKLREDSAIFINKGTLRVWLTDDEYKMPVLMRSKVFIGSVSVKLKSYSR